MTNLPTAAAGPRGLQPTDMESAWRMAKAIAQSGMAPKGYGNGEQLVAAIFTAMQLGAEVGLSPMAAVQNIAVINGKPGLYGPGMLAVVEASGKLADIDEEVTGDGDQRMAVCTVQRVSRGKRTFTFSVADAKRAGLWGKSGPWSQYPDRMLGARARTFALRDTFPDVLLGLAYGAEELEDVQRHVGPDNARDITPPRPTRSQFDAQAIPERSPIDTSAQAQGGDYPDDTQPFDPAQDATLAALDTPAVPVHRPVPVNQYGVNWEPWLTDIGQDIRRAPTVEWLDKLHKLHSVEFGQIGEASEKQYARLWQLMKDRRAVLLDDQRGGA